MSDPIIRMTPNVELKLTAWALATNGKEFSGLGLIEKQDNIFHVIDVDLLGVGSSVFTEFSADRQMALVPDPRRKLWFHRHPIMGWSSTDQATATQTPLGTDPKLVQWSVAIVLTPAGWIGRVDIHVPTLRTFHCPVEPKLPSEETIAAARELVTPQLMQVVDQLLLEYEQRVAERSRQYRQLPQQTNFFSYYEFDEVLANEERYGTGCYCPDCGLELQLIDDTVVYDECNVLLYECTQSCGELFVHFVSNLPEVAQRITGPRKEKTRRRDWRKSWLNVFGGKR